MGLFGRVLDIEGRPATRFMIFLTDGESPDGATYLRQFQSDDGRFVVDDVPIGKYDCVIRAYKPDSIQSIRISGIELKEGYMCGEINAQLIAEKTNK